MTTDRKALNRWARDHDCADFDTYIRVGGSILDARRMIRQQILDLKAALAALDSQTAGQRTPQAETLILEHGAEAEPPDPHNAHPQGAEQ